MPNLENDLSLTCKASTAKDVSSSLQAGAAGLSKSVARDAQAQRNRASTLAKQRQASQRVALVASQPASGVDEAARAAQELKCAGVQR